MGSLWRPAIAIAALLTSNPVLADPRTLKHEAGRCAIRGTCGKDSFFGPELPCPDNGLAGELEKDARTALVELCGPKWDSGPVCCEAAQVSKHRFWSLEWEIKSDAWEIFERVLILAW